MIWSLIWLISPLLALNYSRYQLINVKTDSINEARELHRIGNSYSVEFISLPTANKTSQIIISPDLVDDFLNQLTAQNLPYNIHPKYVDELLHEEQSQREYGGDGFRAWRPYQRLADVYNKFPRYGEMMRWMRQVVRDHPQLAQIESIGKTYEGKPTMILKLSSGEFGHKPVVWIDGAIHGREWISATTVLYLAHQVLESHLSGKTELLKRYDWIFLPVANPDGYEFSHSSNRLWRKNRRPVVMGCYGIDLNRNFGHHWGVTKGSVSSQGCSDEYGGKGPFSEPETRNIRSYLSSLGGRLHVYLSFHSYSQLWLVPWGYTSEKPDDYHRLMCVAKQAVEAARAVHGLDYKVGTLSDILYAAAGGSFDWAKASGAAYSYTIELRPSPEKVGLVVDRGFLATPNDILPAGQEMWAALKALINSINNHGCS